MNIVRIQGERERLNKLYYEVDIDNPPIGVGGMGQVYRGYQVSEITHQRRNVAVKFLDESLPKHIIERAMREAEIDVKHENLLEMLGFVQTEEQTPSGSVITRNHVVSELLDGVMLYDIIHKDKTTNPAGETIPYAVELCEMYHNNRVDFAITVIKSMLSGVMALHDKGYIHRDLDPSNVMVTVDGKIKIIDFGIAKKISALTTLDRPLTVAGQVVCKPEYAAPEQSAGDFRYHNVTTDLYALGIMLYEFVTGSLPFSGDMYELIEKHRTQKVPVENVANKSLRRIILKATAKKQRERYQSVAQFRAELESVIMSESEVKKTDSKPVNKGIIISLGLGVLGFAFGSLLAILL